MGATAPRSPSHHGGSKGVVDPQCGPQDLPGFRVGPRIAVQCQAPVDHFTYWHWRTGRTPLLLPGSPKALCPCPSPQSPPAPSLLFKRSCTGDVLLTPRCRSSRTEGLGSQPIAAELAQGEEPRALHPTAPGRLFPLPAGDASAGFTHSGVKPPAELRSAAGSLQHQTSLSSLLPWPFIPSLCFIPCIARFIPSPVHRRFPSARTSQCCCERDPGRKE